MERGQDLGRIKTNFMGFCSDTRGTRGEVGLWLEVGGDKGVSPVSEREG